MRRRAGAAGAHAARRRHVGARVHGPAVHPASRRTDRACGGAGYMHAVGAHDEGRHHRRRRRRGGGGAAAPGVNSVAPTLNLNSGRGRGTGQASSPPGAARARAGRRRYGRAPSSRRRSCRGPAAAPRGRGLAHDAAEPILLVPVSPMSGALLGQMDVVRPRALDFPRDLLGVRPAAASGRTCRAPSCSGSRQIHFSCRTSERWPRTGPTSCPASGARAGS